MTSSRCPRRPTFVALLVVLVLAGGCGDSNDDVQNPDEATFCRLALANEPVAEADASVLRRLAELAPDEVDAEVDVLRDAAEELEEHTPLSPEAVALEFEVRLRDDFIAARARVDAFLLSDCREELEELEELEGDEDEPGVDEVDEVEKHEQKLDEQVG